MAEIIEGLADDLGAARSGALLAVLGYLTASTSILLVLAAGAIAVVGGLVMSSSASEDRPALTLLRFCYA